MSDNGNSDNPGVQNLVGAIVDKFLFGPLSVLFVMFAQSGGIFAVFPTLREKDPQIVVPMVDVNVLFPCHSPGATEQLVAVPLERLLWQISGIEPGDKTLAGGNHDQ